MIQFFTKKIINRKGFTLIELIVVIAIIAILAAVGIPRLTGFRETARRSNDEQVAAQIANAAAIYLASKPTHADVLTVAQQTALYAELEDSELLATDVDTVGEVELLLESEHYVGLQINWDGDTVTVWLLDQTAGDAAPAAANILYTVIK